MAITHTPEIMKAENEEVLPGGTSLPATTDNAPESSQPCVVIGDQSGEPAVTIRPSTAFSDFGAAERRDLAGDTLGRLGAALQSIPSVLVAGEAHGKQLYEVVINGELIRAADGNGYRAMTLGPKGIQEHGRLFENGGLQNMINAAAVWQVASVVVAQKHLADISRKLDQITEGVSGIARFLDSEREAKIEAAWRYLVQAKRVFAAGELPVSMRTQLEQCERDLTGIQIHLHKEFMAVLEKPVAHTETVGTEELARDISGKLAQLGAIVGSLELCLQTQIAAWHVLSLFPGEPRLKEVRHQDIQQAVYDLGALVPVLDREIDRDIGAVASVFTPGSRLRQRRGALREEADALAGKISDAWSVTDRGLRHVARLLCRHDEPVRLLLCYENGRLEEMRQAF
jgi:hypothetical protein